MSDTRWCRRPDPRCATGRSAQPACERAPSLPGAPGHRIVSWITGLDAGTVAAVRRVADPAEAIDGVAPLSGHLLEALGTGQDDYILASVGPRIIGVAVSHHDDPIEFVVAPEHRREGLGTELMHTALARIPAVWAHGH